MHGNQDVLLGRFLPCLLLAVVLAGTAYASNFAASGNAVTLSNITIDVGQTSLANVLVTGGSAGPYSGEWTWISANEVNYQGISAPGISGPNTGAFTTSGAYIYITSGSGESVSVANVVSGTVVNTIGLGSSAAYSIAINPSNTLAYVQMDTSPGTINVIGIASNTVVNTIVVGADPVGGAFNPSGTLFYAPNSGASTVSVINVASNSVINTINVGTNPVGVAFNPSGTLAYVVNTNSGSLSVINVASNTVVNTIGIIDSPYSVAVNPTGTFAYVATGGGGSTPITIDKVNLTSNTVVNSLMIDHSYDDRAQTLALNPSGTLEFVLRSDDPASETVIDAVSNTILYTIEGGYYTSDIKVNPSGTLFYLIGATSVGAINDLPESAVQTLPEPQPSHGALQLAVNVVNSDTVAFTFNGVTYTQSTGSSTVYGQWKLYGFAQDNGTNIYYYGSNALLFSNTIEVNPALGTPTISSSNILYLNINQYTTFYAYDSGGTPPYTYNFLVYNSVSNAVVANMLTTSNTFTWHVTGSAGNTITANVFVADSATTSSISNSVQVAFSAYPRPTLLSVTPSNSIALRQTYELLTANLSGPSSAYTGNFYVTNSMNGNVIANSLASGLLGASATFSYTVPQDSNALGTENILFSYTDAFGVTNTISNTITVEDTNNAPVLSIASNRLTYGQSVSITATPNPIAVGVANIVFNGIQVASGTGAQVYNTCGNTIAGGACISPGTYSVYACDYDSNICSQANTIVVAKASPYLQMTPSPNTTYNGQQSSASYGIATYHNQLKAGLYVNGAISSNTITGPIRSGFITGLDGPYGVAFAPSGTYAYAADSGTGKVSIIDTATNTITGSITGFSSPRGIAFSPSGTYAYVSDSGSAALYIVNTATNAVTGSILGFEEPFGVALAPSGTFAYVPDYASGTVYIVSTATNAVTGSISGFSRPYSASFSPTGNYAYVSDGDGTVKIVSTATNTVTNTISGFSAPTGVAISPSGAYAYVTNYGTTLSIVNTSTNSIVETISGFSYPYGLAIHSSGTYSYIVNYNGTISILDNEPVNVYATNSSSIPAAAGVYTLTASTPGNQNYTSNSISRYFNISKASPILSLQLPANATYTGKPSTVFSDVYTYLNQVQSSLYLNGALVAGTPAGYLNYTIQGFNYPYGVSIAPSGAYAYVTNQGNSSISTINTTTRSISNTVLFLGGSGYPAGITIAPSGAYAYITDQNYDTASVFNTTTRTVTNTINGFSYPFDIAFSPSGTLAYVVDYSNQTIEIINTATNSVIGYLPFSGCPLGIAMSESGAYAYVTDQCDAYLYTLNTTTGAVESTVSGFYNPYGVALSPSGAYAYVVDYNNDTVDVIDTATNSIMDILPGFNDPYEISVSPTGSYAYVTNSGNSTVSVISTGTTAYNVTAVNNYDFTLSTTGNSNYTSNSISASFSILPTTTIPCTNGCYTGSGGSGSGQQPASTIPATTTTMPTNTTTAATTVATTTVPQTTTVVPVFTYNVTTKNATVTINMSSESPHQLSYKPGGATFVITSPSQVQVSFKISNVTSSSPMAPRNYTKLIALNVSINSTNVSAYTVLHYPCKASPASVAPFILNGTAWKRISPFTVDSAACTISFQIPNDPTVALLESNSTANTTSVATSVAVTTVQQQQQLQAWPYAAAIIAIILIVALAALAFMRRRSHAKSASKGA